MTSLMERLARCAAGDGPAIPGDQDLTRFLDFRRASPRLPDRQVIARLRLKLEQAALDNDADQVRVVMDEVVAVLGKALPLALPPPLPKGDPQGADAREPAREKDRTPPPLPRAEAVPPARAAGLASAPRRANDAARERPAWSAMPWRRGKGRHGFGRAGRG